MVTFLTALHIFVCIFLIIVVLLQAGKGGGMGIAFGGGGGGSQTVFGSSGAGNFLTRMTAVTAFLFLVTSLGLAHYSSQQDSSRLQRLAERKGAEKKVEDERAAKLKAELDKAREAASASGANSGKKPAGADVTAPNSSEAPAAPFKVGGGKPGDLKLAAPGADKAGDPSPGVKAKGKAKPATDEAAKPADGDAPRPKKKRHVAPADGETNAAPAAPAQAPAAPAP